MKDLNWIERLIARIMIRRILKGVNTMTLPKWVGHLSALGSVASFLGGMAGYLPPQWGTGVAALATLLAWVSHSAFGTGGTKENP